MYSKRMSHSLAMLPPAIFLMGPTASGKTDVAIRLAQEYPIDIISVDSSMDIAALILARLNQLLRNWL